MSKPIFQEPNNPLIDKRMERIKNMDKEREQKLGAEWAKEIKEFDDFLDKFNLENWQRDIITDNMNKNDKEQVIELLDKWVGLTDRDKNFIEKF